MIIHIQYEMESVVVLQVQYEMFHRAIFHNSEVYLEGKIPFQLYMIQDEHEMDKEHYFYIFQKQPLHHLLLVQGQ